MTEDTSVGLSDGDLPGLFSAADAASLQGQRRYILAVKLRLVFAVVAAATGVATLRVGDAGTDLLAIGTMVALLVIVIVELHLKSARPEDAWYDGRALAESAKSLGWRYAVGAAPFRLEGDSAHSEVEFANQIRALLTDAESTDLKPTTAAAVSAAMRDLRRSPLETRKEVYLHSRIEDQQSWYSNKADQNERLSHKWKIALLVIETLGFFAALAKVIGLIDFDLAGVVAALIGASAAWLAVRQYATNARAYSFAAHELSIVRGRLEPIDNDDSWASEVADAEEAISREHTMWRASRSRS